MSHSHSQKSLTEFDAADQTPTKNPTNENPQEQQFTTPANTTFGEVPNPYPEGGITEYKTGYINTNLCTPNGGTVSVEFNTIAGRGGMGSNTSIKHATEINALAQTCKQLPAVLTGGGTITPMGSGAIFGRLRDTTKTPESVKIELEELYHENGHCREETRSRKLGPYKLSLPATADDCRKAITALSAWEQGKIEYLNPVEREKKLVTTERVETFKGLSPGDKVKTAVYTTRLDTISEPFETHAIIPRGTLSNRSIPVIAVTVDNPRGGYYQLGIEKPDQSLPGNDVPTCYLSHSSNSPPTPNTAFTKDNKFPSTDLEVMTIDHPPNPTITPPNKDVMESPLPEPRLRTPLTDINGIGEKSSRQIRENCQTRTSADSIAHDLFNNGEIHTELSAVKSVLDSLPNHDEIYNQLESYTPN